MPRKYRIKDVPVIGSVTGQNHEKGDIVYQCTKHDYGLADEDTHFSGIVHISVTLDENGDYPFFTVPIHNLEEITDD